MRNSCDKFCWPTFFYSWPIYLKVMGQLACIYEILDTALLTTVALLCSASSYYLSQHEMGIS